MKIVGVKRLTLILGSVAIVGCKGAGPHDCVAYWPDLPMSVVSIPEDPPTIQLQELWRTGGSAEGQEIAELASITTSSEGYTAVVDFALGQVSVVSPAGEWLGAWGRKGRGPGELTMPVAANWSGDTLVVFDIIQSKVIRYVSSSFVSETRIPAEFGARVAMSGSIDYAAVTSAGAVILQQPLATTEGRDSSVVSLLLQRPRAARPDTFSAARVSTVEWRGGLIPQPGAPVPLVVVGADGWMARSAGDGSYRLLVSGRTSQRQLCAAVAPLPLTDQERGVGEVPEGFEDAFAAVAGVPAPATLNAIGRLIVSSTGEVWTDQRRPAPFTREKMFGAPGGTLDVFSITGNYVGRAEIPGDVSIQAVSDSMVIGVQFSELDETSIIGYRLIR